MKKIKKSQWTASTSMEQEKMLRECGPVLVTQHGRPLYVVTLPGDEIRESSANYEVKKSG